MPVVPVLVAAGAIYSRNSLQLERNCSGRHAVAVKREKSFIAEPSFRIWRRCRLKPLSFRRRPESIPDPESDPDLIAKA
jgi:hypothetical protein